MKKSLVLLMSTFALMFGLVGCSSSEQTVEENKNETVEMVTVTDIKGEVEIPANPQRIVDLSHKDRRRARAGGINMIPTSTGATCGDGPAGNPQLSQLPLQRYG